ncbi:ribonuclease HII [Bacillus sp. B15-48]|uniref:ribonuclease HII n=1 Tax=Bacillus sp. B15-48 TaxID=1548601 RepID=UPI00193F4361|nr:ribonuclease HII [Bacillus sp. B15-48]MBM4763949.1 ribonuclease HII [Bacillus sp. B15-48]
MGKLTVEEIEKMLEENNEIDEAFIQLLEKDERKGVQRLLKKWMRQKEKERLLHKKYVEMTSYERQFKAQGFQFIAGIDEVGRGPLAGPVVAAAVILPDDFYLPGIDDSKKLSEQKRNDYFDKIRSEAIAIGIGFIDALEIDRINILQASKKAMNHAIAQLPMKPDFLLVDAVKLETPYPAEAIIKGDSRSVTIAAASIIAKVTRDRFMREIHNEYPQYGFGSNMGYGTAEHLAAISREGITPYHRKSFAPIKSFSIQEK